MKFEKFKKLVTNLHDKTKYDIHIRNLNHGVILKKVHRVIEFNQKARLKSYIDINTKQKKQKIILRKILSGWRIMQFSEKLWRFWKKYGKYKKA